VWTEDEAGPYQTAPYAGESWHPAGQPLRLPHEHLRNGTAKLLVLFEPSSGQARVQGVSSTANAVLHPWMKQELTAILAALPAAPPVEDAPAKRRAWQRWPEGLRWPLGLPETLPALRLLLVLDNLAGHLTQALVCWMFTVGIMPLYTPLGGSWLNMAESFQRILKRRALGGQHPQSSAEITALLEQTATGWNRHPTPFEWGGRRAFSSSARAAAPSCPWRLGRLHPPARTLAHPAGQPMATTLRSDPLAYGLEQILR
jgi:DDE superfamily endonuclease